MSGDFSWWKSDKINRLPLPPVDDSVGKCNPISEAMVHITKNRICGQNCKVRTARSRPT